MVFFAALIRVGLATPSSLMDTLASAGVSRSSATAKADATSDLVSSGQSLVGASGTGGAAIGYGRAPGVIGLCPSGCGTGKTARRTSHQCALVVSCIPVPLPAAPMGIDKYLPGGNIGKKRASRGNAQDDGPFAWHPVVDYTSASSRRRGRHRPSPYGPEGDSRHGWWSRASLSAWRSTVRERAALLARLQPESFPPYSSSSTSSSSSCSPSDTSGIGGGVVGEVGRIVLDHCAAIHKSSVQPPMPHGLCGAGSLLLSECLALLSIGERGLIADVLQIDGGALFEVGYTGATLNATLALPDALSAHVVSLSRNYVVVVPPPPQQQQQQQQQGHDQPRQAGLNGGANGDGDGDGANASATPVVEMPRPIAEASSRAPLQSSWEWRESSPLGLASGTLRAALFSATMVATPTAAASDVKTDLGEMGVTGTPFNDGVDSTRVKQGRTVSYAALDAVISIAALVRLKPKDDRLNAARKKSNSRGVSFSWANAAVSFASLLSAEGNVFADRDRGPSGASGTSGSAHGSNAAPSSGVSAAAAAVRDPGGDSAAGGAITLGTIGGRTNNSNPVH